MHASSKIRVLCYVRKARMLMRVQPVAVLVHEDLNVQRKVWLIPKSALVERGLSQIPPCAPYAQLETVVRNQVRFPPNV